jgi:proliferating cell nuclear antigen
MTPIPKESCRFFLKSVQGSAFKTLFEVLKELVHDSNMIFHPEGIRLTAIDSVKTSFIYLRLKASSFEEYTCKTPTTVGLDLSSVHKLIKSCSAHDTITLYVLESNTQELCIRIESPEHVQRTDYKLRLLDIDSQEISLPDLEYDHIFTLPSTTFFKLCREMMNLSPHMCITSKQKTLELSCSGDFASQHTCIGEADLSDDSDPISASYSLKYLTLFSKASSLCNTTTLYIKRDCPLLIQYAVAGLGDLKFLLSPLVTDL